ncbi:DEAD/DEAH box helicase [Kribbella sandramycini]|uniref:ATP-dependent RNA helicase HelY n=1 Tax=Kribbella sandramycini TaxID=60450 RepID=A0A7Y4L6F7_9ACTN|nr:DEAD/DEAH box helicase [Kribbella sandramycini]MBB6570910.1 ATP-dependent RNA helicase HelY [Kribbella sandramycini]NOL44041.1 DEAD/DEAH box helicase [Kribbella sandramycini]
MSTPSEKYAVFRSDQEHPAVKEFRGLYDFALDEFQLRACAALEDGHQVLVAAPTGSGKTLVGEFAVHLALQRGQKCFYTTPIKALSNQKYADLVSRYGAERVGLLTGDNSINSEAPIVVMTTEVLRNMLYAGSSTLLGLSYVVMDEVHYLADRSRGAVWEEVIIHLPDSVSVVSLSATVSNAEEFGDWLATVRGNTVVVLEEKRPVPLFQHVMVGKRLHDLFAGETPTAGAGAQAQFGPSAGRPNRSGNPAKAAAKGSTTDLRDLVNPQLVKIARDDNRIFRDDSRKPRRRRDLPKGRPTRSHFTPFRSDVVEELDAGALLPAIYFIFSRKGCEDAMLQCLRSGLRLTKPSERDEIKRVLAERTIDLPDEDLGVLGYHDFAEALSRGIAAHHAGMLAAFKEVVEELFARGLIKVVFATETLALGINMPARTVVLEKLSKWNGEAHVDITPGEYTQLTGRAGRRGIDVEGHAVVLWQPGFDPRAVAGLASTRTYPLRSSFSPSYNMAVNLVRQVGRTRARDMLELSFAQFQSDQAVVGLARQVQRNTEALEGYKESIDCHLGDFLEYAALRRRIGDRESSGSKARKQDRRAEAQESIEKLRIGDIIRIPAGRSAGWALVLDPGMRSEREGPRPTVLTLDRQVRKLSMIDFPTPVEAIGSLRIPKKFNARNPQQRRELAQVLRVRSDMLGEDGPPSRTRGRDVVSHADDPELQAMRAELRAHPCHGCSDREDHARWAERYFRLDRENRDVQRKIEQRTNTIARQFDRVCQVLDALHYLDGDKTTEAGDRLARIYTELDLVAAECLRQGIFDELTVPELAAALAALVYESRSKDEPTSPRLPRGDVRIALEKMGQIWRELSALERDMRVDFLRSMDLGFCWPAFRWSSGASLAEVLYESDLAAGDFVRWTKQLIDLTEQVADAAGDTPLRKTARAVVEEIRRGVISYAAVVDES